jgi:hypothetical protein
MNTDAFYAYWRGWFAQPAEAKEPHRRVKGPCTACEATGYVARIVEPRLDTCLACNGTGRINKGSWYPPGVESPGYSGKPDPKEYYHYRINQRDRVSNFDTHDLFRDCFYQAERWLLDRELNAVARAVKPVDCVLRILHYLPTPDGLAGEAHRDFDLLTVNIGGTSPGLEVHGGWRVHGIGPLADGPDCWNQREGGIHVGEMLEIYNHHGGSGFASDQENEYLPALTHRVRIPPNTERFAAVFFYLPPADFVLRPGLTTKQYLDDVLKRAGTAEGAKR